ncbi:MAG: LPS export ABC transporter permease LptF [Nitrospirae bacterium]|nr:LPS export ABC transporter permease LptF [Nitrospirota bacterium]
MLLIHRMILKELVSSFIIALLFLNFALMMEKLLKLSRLLSGVGASLLDVGKIVLYLQPQLCILTIPMAFLLSVLLTFGRMNADNELTVLKASGISLKKISRPVLYMGLVCFVLSLGMSFYFSPKGSLSLRAKVTEILTVRAPMTIEEGVFNTAFKDIVILVKSKPEPDKLAGIFIVDERKKEEPKIILAKKGSIVTDNDAISFTLISGQAYITKGDTITEITFGRYNFRLNPTLDSGEKKNRELTPLQLLKEAKEPAKADNAYLELHRRFSLPAICLIIVFLGPPLSLMAGRSGRLGGLTIGLGVFAVYYALLIFGENLVRAGKLPHFGGAWLSFTLLVVFSILIYERVNRR